MQLQLNKTIQSYEISQFHQQNTIFFSWPSTEELMTAIDLNEYSLSPESQENDSATDQKYRRNSITVNIQLHVLRSLKIIHLISLIGL